MWADYLDCSPYRARHVHCSLWCSHVHRPTPAQGMPKCHCLRGCTAQSTKHGGGPVSTCRRKLRAWGYYHGPDQVRKTSKERDQGRARSESVVEIDDRMKSRSSERDNCDFEGHPRSRGVQFVSVQSKPAPRQYVFPIPGAWPDLPCPAQALGVECRRVTRCKGVSHAPTARSAAVLDCGLRPCRVKLGADSPNAPRCRRTG